MRGKVGGAGIGWAAACCFLLAAQFAPASTLAGRWLLSQWHRRVWQIEDGLPHNYVTAISYDSDRYLLVGTQTGLARFDGIRFTPLADFSNDWIYSLLPASDGSLWVGTYRNGLFRVRNGHAEHWGASKGFRDTSVYSLVEDRKHGVWAASEAGLQYVDGKSVRTVVRGANTSGYAWQALTLDQSGALWFAAQNGLFRHSGGTTTAFKVKGASGLPVTVYFWNSTLYLGTTNGLDVLHCAGARCEARAVPGVTGPVVGLRAAADGALWVATWGRGLYRLTGERTERLSAQEGLADDFVRVFYEDNEHNIWVGTRGGGLTRFRATALKPVGIPEGLGGNCASVVTGDGGAGVWLGTWRSGLFHWRNGHVEAQAWAQPPLNVLITSLAVNAARALWIGTMQDLWVLPQGARQPMRTLAPGPATSISHLLFSRRGELWLAKDGQGIYLFPSGDPRTSKPEQLLPTQTVTALFEDTNGAIWIGAGQGLWKTGQNSHSLQLIDPAAREVTAISRDSRSRIWIASSAGQINIYVRGVKQAFHYENLPAPEVYSILEDGHGEMWFSTGRGLARASMLDIDKSLQSPGKLAGLSAYGVAEGMRTIECRCARQPQSWKMSDGTLWVPTAKGFLQIDPERGERGAPPRPVIEALTLDGKLVPAGKALHIPAGRHEFQASFTAVRLGLAEGVRFRYRMEGLEPDWIKAGTVRLARYGQLPPGQFRFAVSARDAGGSWSAPVWVAIDQRPGLYQTAWFRAFVLLVLANLALLGLRLRLRLVRARYTAVLEERNRIAREFHDTLLAGLSAASWQLDAALEQCRGQAAERGLNTARGMLRYCRDEARRAVGALRDEPEPEPPVAVAIENALQQMTAGTAVRATLEVDQKVAGIESDLSLNLVRICQEATSNAMRHGQASKVTVQLRSGFNEIVLTIKDNGVGGGAALMNKPRPGHFGILGMRERVDRFGGRLNITSSLGEGTLVEAIVPTTLLR